MNNGIAFSLVALVGLLVAGPAGAMEQRCAELGGSCFVSEPMNTNDYQVSCTGTGNTPDIDFGDTEGPGSKEAQIAWNRCDAQFPVATTTSDVALPTGSSAIDWVMRVDPDSINQGYNNAQSTLPGGLQRVCMRMYRKHSSNFLITNAGSDGCGANKFMEFWSNAGTAIQLSNGGATTDGVIDLWSGSYGDQIPKSGSRIVVDDCTDNWCRHEVCVSSPGDIKDFRQVTLEGYSEQVGVANPKRYDYGPTFIGDQRGSLGEMWFATGYRERCASRTPQDVGYFYLSHAMIAGWNSNGGQFIGVAPEVEGGGGITPPPPPPPLPPAPPVLLVPAPSDAPDFAASNGALSVTATVGGLAATVSATLSPSVGPFQFLVDCNSNGNWDGVDQAQIPSSEHQCTYSSAGAKTIRVWVWDEGSNTNLELDLPIAL